MSLCEVRMPAYKRPELLKRAIKSLLEQTYKNWIVIVMDDSPMQECRAVVECYNDSRIMYSPNKTQLGPARNLDQAFQSAGYVGGSYAFVLEDDNYLFPCFIAANITSIRDNGVAIVLRNQDMRFDKDGESMPYNKTTMGDWYCHKVYEPAELFPYLFFHSGISNGGLFWDTAKITSDLQIGTEVASQAHQEKFRCLQLTDRICFEPEPLCVFTLFKARDDAVEPSKRAKRLYNRTEQSLIMYLLKRFGPKIVKRSTEIADQMGCRYQLERQLIDGFYLLYDFKRVRGLRFLYFLSKSLLRYLLYGDPLGDYYKKIRHKTRD
ncbi:MAG: hypothetical protein A2Z72_05805 [Omnitrophica bacterium RBG_13_46_9]|nr:MAG: hypothetical protein A2Z72_05805 [Omnitrophica bacterium RBG_13_46_9]